MDLYIDGVIVPSDYSPSVSYEGQLSTFINLYTGGNAVYSEMAGLRM